MASGATTIIAALYGEAPYRSIRKPSAICSNRRFRAGVAAMRSRCSAGALRYSICGSSGGMEARRSALAVLRMGAGGGMDAPAQAPAADAQRTPLARTHRMAAGSGRDSASACRAGQQSGVARMVVVRARERRSHAARGAMRASAMADASAPRLRCASPVSGRASHRRLGMRRSAGPLRAVAISGVRPSSCRAVPGPLVRHRAPRSPAGAISRVTSRRDLLSLSSPPRRPDARCSMPPPPMP
jgi:hypothetical protein